MIKYSTGSWRTGKPEKLDVVYAFDGYYLNLNSSDENGGDEYHAEETLFATASAAALEIKKMLVNALEDNARQRARLIAVLEET